VHAQFIDRAEFIITNPTGAVIGYAGQPLDTTGMPADATAHLNAILYDVPSGDREIISTDPSAAAAGNGLSGALRISRNGQTVVFTSRATNLVPGPVYPGAPANTLRQLFAHDLSTGVTQLVSIDATNTTGANIDDVSDVFAVSADGRYVAFASRADNLVPNIAYTPNEANVFVRDLVDGITELVSISTDGTSAGCCGGTTHSLFPAISDDGRYVAFMSTATNLVAGKTYTPNVAGVGNVFMRDRLGGSTQLLSLSHDGTQASNGSCNVQVPSGGSYMTPDASAVAFTCRATNLVSGPTYPTNPSDVYLWRRDTGTVILVSRSFDGTEAADNGAFRAVLSANGRFVAFQSPAFNLVDGVTYFVKGPGGPGVSNIYRWDQTSGVTQLVTRSVDGTTGADFDTQFPSISEDGEVIAFGSAATNLSSLEVPLTFDDRQNNATFWTSASNTVAIASLNSANLPMGEVNPAVELSGDGSLVVFLWNLTRSAYAYERQ
jgi:Tol biopolymer transport system component